MGETLQRPHATRGLAARLLAGLLQAVGRRVTRVDRIVEATAVAAGVRRTLRVAPAWACVSAQRL